MPVKIFFCYAHEDEALLNKLKTHLRPLQRQGLIDAWHDRDISPGTKWEYEISQHLNSAQIILLLVSSDFMDSDYCYGIEMKRALERHERGEARVIPVILRHVYWQGEPLGKLQALPKDAKPITDPDWHSLDRAFLSVAEGIHKAVMELIPKPLPKPVKIAEKAVKEQPLISPLVTPIWTKPSELEIKAAPRQRELGYEQPQVVRGYQQPQSGFQSGGYQQEPFGAYSGYQQPQSGFQPGGYQQEPFGAPPSGAQSLLGTSSMGMQPNVAAGLSYVLLWVTGLIFFLMEKQNRFVRFHAMQSILFFGGITVVEVLLNIINAFNVPFLWIITLLIGAVLGIVAFVGYIVLLTNGFQGKYFKLPIVGDYAEKYAN
jgi:uncharacterized membrane protein